MTKKRLVVFFSVFTILIVFLGLVSHFNGDGGLRKMVTLGGIYSVEPKGYDVVCFVEKSMGALSCLPNKNQLKVR